MCLLNVWVSFRTVSFSYGHPQPQTPTYRHTHTHTATAPQHPLKLNDLPRDQGKTQIISVLIAILNSKLFMCISWVIFLHYEYVI